MQRSVMRFNLICESVNVPELFGFCNKTNSGPWMGKAKNTCKIRDFQQKRPQPQGKTALMDHAEFEISIEYRAPNCVVEDHGGFWWEGWKLKHVDVKKDGTLLDGKGNPLPEGLSRSCSNGRCTMRLTSTKVNSDN